MARAMRVKAMFRRIEFERDRSSAAKERVQFGGVEINTGNKEVRFKNEVIELTPNEFEFLTYLFKNKDRAVSREELLNKVWGYDEAVETRVCDDTLKRLRKKINKTGILIETVWVFGFRLKEK